MTLLYILYPIIVYPLIFLSFFISSIVKIELIKLCFPLETIQKRINNKEEYCILGHRDMGFVPVIFNIDLFGEIIRFEISS